jgi:hypothetical protein
VLQLNSAFRPVAILAAIASSALDWSGAIADPTVPYKSDWMEVQATDGSVYKIDRKSVSHFSNGTSEIIVFAVHDGPYDPRNVRRLWFDCHGHFQDHTDGVSRTEYATPGSMAAHFSAIACSPANEGQSSTAAEPAARYSARQIEAIRTTHLAGWADKHCAGIVSAPAALGDTLIDAGIEISDFDTSEFKRIKEEADAQFAKEPVRTRCEKLWRMFGPAGVFGRQLVRLRPPSDPLTQGN